MSEVPVDPRPIWEDLVAGTITGRAHTRLAKELIAGQRDDVVVAILHLLRESMTNATRAANRTVAFIVGLLVLFELILQGGGEIESVSGVALSRDVALIGLPVLVGGLMVRLGQTAVDLNNYYVASRAFTAGLGWESPSVQVTLASNTGFDLVGDNNWMETIPWTPSRRLKLAEISSTLSYFGCLVALPLWAAAAAVRLAIRLDDLASIAALVVTGWIAVAYVLALGTYAAFAPIPFWRFLRMRSTVLE